AFGSMFSFSKRLTIQKLVRCARSFFWAAGPTQPTSNACIPWEVWHRPRPAPRGVKRCSCPTLPTTVGDAPSSRLATGRIGRNERHRIYAHDHLACELQARVGFQ